MRSSAITRGFAPREEGCERGSAGGGEPSRGTSSGSSLLRLSGGVVDGRGDREAARTVWFYRDYVRLAGGHAKHAHYFEHVRRMPGFAPRITFSGAPANESVARERRRLWPPGAGAVAEGWEPERGDVLFVAGVDWRYLAESGLEELPIPRINLVPGVRHARAGTELHRYLEEPAIRICVSEEVADAVAATGRARGPVLTIPNGIDVAPFEPDRNGSPARFEARSSAVTIVGYKQPELARDLARRLDAEGVRIRGEATPIYLFFPEIAPELKRYNPRFKVIVLLRDPVERAI